MNEYDTFIEAFNVSIRNDKLLTKDLWNLIELLIKDLDICKSNYADLEKQIGDLIEIEDVPSSKQYVDGEECLIRIKEENIELKSHIKIQNAEFKVKLSELKKFSELKQKELEEEITQLNQRGTEREKEFFEELQSAQAMSAYEFEKVEQKLKWQLAEANKQLNQANVINSKLRMQLQNFEKEPRRYYSEKNTIRPPSNDNNVGINEYNPKLNHNSKSEQTITTNQSKQDEELTTNRPGVTTYEPLQVEVTDGSPTTETALKLYRPPIFKGKNPVSKERTFNRTKSSGSCSVPPLMPCSKSKPQRKRKLHDPEDLSYLINLMSNDE